MTIRRAAATAAGVVALGMIVAALLPSGHHGLRGPANTEHLYTGGNLPPTLFSTCENGVADPGETVTTCPWDVQPSMPEELPNFAVVTPGDRLHEYLQRPGPGPVWRFADERLSAAVERTSPGIWRLVLEARQPLVTVYFPWRANHYAVNGPVEDDTVYYPYLGGVFEREASRGDFEWWGQEYPGNAFAPLVIVADPHFALLVAARNWPPKHAVALHANRQTAVAYPDRVRPGTTTTYGAMVVRVEGSPQAGYQPWQLALERYRSWIDTRVATTAPAWMIQGEGFLSVGLQNAPSFDEAAVAQLWGAWKQHFGWIQIWGQMSNYAGPPRLAEPRLSPGEQTGCCLRRQALHPRYERRLPAIVRSITADGYHAGYYSREPESERLDSPSDAAWLARWITRNRDVYGANAFYVDVIGHRYLGEPGAVLRLFEDGTIPAETLIEGFVDAYPRPALLSGAFTGGVWSGGPGVSPITADRGTFVNMARFLMGSRPAYLGESNGDHLLYGWRAQPPHWLERQMFLLGAKGDIANPSREIEGREEPNPYLVRIKELRDRARWWSRDLRYVDTAGLSSVPPGIDARRFVESNGRGVVVVDNHARLVGTSLSVKGCALEIPPDPLSILEVAGCDGQ